jgi:hypothetical protein
MRSFRIDRRGQLRRHEGREGGASTGRTRLNSLRGGTLNDTRHDANLKLRTGRVAATTPAGARAFLECFHDWICEKRLILLPAAATALAAAGGPSDRRAEREGATRLLRRQLHVFGSHLSDSPDLGDLDLVVEVEQRPGVNSIVEASKARFQASGRTARSYPEELMYGRTEVMRFVKGRSPYLSLHDRNELTEGGATAAKVVFEADDVKPWRQP